MLSSQRLHNSNGEASVKRQKLNPIETESYPDVDEFIKVLNSKKIHQHNHKEFLDNSPLIKECQNGGKDYKKYYYLLHQIISIYNNKRFMYFRDVMLSFSKNKKFMRHFSDRVNASEDDQEKNFDIILNIIYCSRDPLRTSLAVYLREFDFDFLERQLDMFVDGIRTIVDTSNREEQSRKMAVLRIALRNSNQDSLNGLLTDLFVPHFTSTTTLNQLMDNSDFKRYSTGAKEVTGEESYQWFKKICSGEKHYVRIFLSFQNNKKLIKHLHTINQSDHPDIDLLKDLVRIYGCSSDPDQLKEFFTIIIKTYPEHILNDRLISIERDLEKKSKERAITGKGTEYGYLCYSRVLLLSGLGLKERKKHLSDLWTDLENRNASAIQWGQTSDKILENSEFTEGCCDKNISFSFLQKILNIINCWAKLTDALLTNNNALKVHCENISLEVRKKMLVDFSEKVVYLAHAQRPHYGRLVRFLLFNNNELQEFHDELKKMKKNRKRNDMLSEVNKLIIVTDNKNETQKTVSSGKGSKRKTPFSKEKAKKMDVDPVVDEKDESFSQATTNQSSAFILRRTAIEPVVEQNVSEEKEAKDFGVEQGQRDAYRWTGDGIPDVNHPRFAHIRDRLQEKNLIDEFYKAYVEQFNKEREMLKKNLAEKKQEDAKDPMYQYYRKKYPQLPENTVLVGSKTFAKHFQKILGYEAHVADTWHGKTQRHKVALVPDSETNEWKTIALETLHERDICTFEGVLVTADYKPNLDSMAYAITNRTKVDRIERDPSRKGNEGCIVNHSVRPNAEYCHDGKGNFYIALLPGKVIYPGEEIVVCYDKNKRFSHFNNKTTRQTAFAWDESDNNAFDYAAYRDNTMAVVVDINSMSSTTTSSSSSSTSTNAYPATGIVMSTSSSVLFAVTNHTSGKEEKHSHGVYASVFAFSVK
ncbi:hypothetical protein AYO45_02035 [Gammaproteobacteria bacterium SCGC AG-212-F23]|nr:hypothetical protein AYO45_02035 [Gammaproteobacteria bacterium SCGC AG-212-F23]